MGALTAAAWVPWLLIGLPAGAWVDRLPARRVMVVSDLVAAVDAGQRARSRGSSTSSRSPTSRSPRSATACAPSSSARPIPALVRQVAPREQQESAFARLFGTESAMQVAGPGVGGLLAQALSAAGGLLVDAVSFLVSAVCLWRLKLPAVEPHPTGDAEVASLGRAHPRGHRLHPPRPDPALLHGDGRRQQLRADRLRALLVLFLVREVHLGSGAVGLVMAVGSLGGVVGATIATRVSRRLGSARALLALQLLAGPPALLVPLGAPGAGLVAMVAGMLLVGIGVVAGNVVRGAWRNRYVPEHMVARQVTTVQVVNFGTMPLAGIAAGAMGSTLGPAPDHRGDGGHPRARLRLDVLEPAARAARHAGRSRRRRQREMTGR